MRTYPILTGTRNIYFQLLVVLPDRLPIISGYAVNIKSKKSWTQIRNITFFILVNTLINIHIMLHMGTNSLNWTKRIKSKSFDAYNNAIEVLFDMRFQNLLPMHLSLNTSVCNVRFCAVAVRMRSDLEDCTKISQYRKEIC